MYYARVVLQFNVNSTKLDYILECNYAECQHMLPDTPYFGSLPSVDLLMPRPADKYRFPACVCQTTML